MMRYPHIFIERKDNGWVYSLKSNAASDSGQGLDGGRQGGVCVDGAPLVLKFRASGPGEGKDFKLTLEEEEP